MIHITYNPSLCMHANSGLCTHLCSCSVPITKYPDRAVHAPVDPRARLHILLLIFIIHNHNCIHQPLEHLLHQMLQCWNHKRNTYHLKQSLWGEHKRISDWCLNPLPPHSLACTEATWGLTDCFSMSDRLWKVMSWSGMFTPRVDIKGSWD